MPGQKTTPVKQQTTASGQTVIASTGAKVGWGAVAEKKAQLEDIKNGKNGKPLYLDIKHKVNFQDNEVISLQILNEEPVCVDGCTMGDNYEFYVSRKPIDGHCIMLDNKLKKTWKAGFKVLDLRGNYDKDAKAYKNDVPVERVWLVGNKVAMALRALKERKGINLTDVILDVQRLGKKTDTTYTIEIATENGKFLEPYDWPKEILPPLVEILAPLPAKVLETIIAGGTPDYEADPNAAPAAINTGAPAAGRRRMPGR